jgi:hypothetical protein
VLEGSGVAVGGAGVADGEGVCGLGVLVAVAEGEGVDVGVAVSVGDGEGVEVGGDVAVEDAVAVGAGVVLLVGAGYS